MTKLHQPHPLSPEESAFAAEHFPQVYAFLSENDLSEDDYYDSAINGFLKAVRQCFNVSDTSDFIQVAKALMSEECTRYNSVLDSEPCIISLCECYESASTLEESIADAKNTMDEAISSIEIERTMQSFTETQQEIVKLLLNGYSKQDIAAMLQMSLYALSNEIGIIQQKTVRSPLMCAA